MRYLIQYYSFKQRQNHKGEGCLSTHKTKKYYITTKNTDDYTSELGHDFNDDDFEAQEILNQQEMEKTKANIDLSHVYSYRDPFVRSTLVNQVGRTTIFQAAKEGFSIVKYRDVTTKDLGKSGDPPLVLHGLENVLFHEGVHLAEGFPSEIVKMPQIEDIEFKRMEKFMRADKDKGLFDVAKQHDDVKFYTSTSSIIPFVSDIYKVFSGYKRNNYSELPSIQENPMQVIPRIYNANYSLVKMENNKWAFVNTTPSDETILSQMGNVLEKYLTQPIEVFESNYIKGKLSEDFKFAPNFYNYKQIGNVLVRSQLDAYHPDLGIFDIKTRAAQGVRYAVNQRSYFINSKINSVTGTGNSFEHEYHDLICTCFLKFSQAKLGSMEGMLISYHNTLKFFGFEYIPLKDMERAVFESQKMAHTSFQVMFAIFTEVMEKITKEFNLLWAQTVLKSKSELKGNQRPIN
eukprot:TRINITY_DN6338_c0_g1_i1.p1 TRINITY_DN6338_c0_g1~~TRINITY_DN6338_c0_g1_i1.p1  ORF type:complete len:460 (+),score=73.74 TRINITY_DN6338_c0_g1_i1:85-1464(+)